MKRGTKSFANWSVGCIAAAFLLSLIAAGILVHLVVRDLTSSYTGVGLNPFQPRSDGSIESPGNPDATPTLIRLESTPQPWDGASRVSVLVMGLDYRDWIAGQGAPRSDTMMLVSVDPITLQASMLSIPRDLWVEIPGFSYNRINTAYMFGEAYDLPGGGPALAIQAVENLIGVPIQFYAVVDFHSFERVVDEIGGIDILVHEGMWISPIDRDSIYLEPKAYHLAGPEALAYARVRYTGGGDFGRAQRQQQVVMAIMDRIVGFDLLPTMISRAPLLYQELASGVRTNLSLEQMISLGWLALKVPKENIRSGVIAPPNMVGFYTRPDGAQVLRFVPDQIRILRDQLFSETSALGPEISVTSQEGYTP
ncbi:MAG: LytR family transcriptional regulator [Anaerolineales bacterium]|nr:MAG: LytR family transcriptional regulator [Anaerolineales bacterium]